jgi:hypothetical protein
MERVLYEKFDGKWMRYGRSFLVESDSAEDFAAYVLKNGVRLLGLSGQIVDSRKTVEPISAICDYSDGQPALSEVLDHIEKMRKESPEVNYFEFTLDTNG